MKTSIAYEEVTQKIIDSMENGVVPWRTPWTAVGPRNLFSKKAYRGVNVWLLSMIGTELPAFATFNQIKEHGGNVLKGSKSVKIYFFSKFKKVDQETDKEFSIPVIRTYNVFTTEQMEGIQVEKYLEKQKDFAPNLDADQLIEKFFASKVAPSLTFKSQDRAFYRPSTDSVVVPPKEQFKDAGSYYSTVFHEMGHATGHEKRLKRDGVATMDPHGRGAVYGFEELVAELTASYLCALTGIDNQIEVDQRAAYIDSWLGVLKKDKAMIWKAASQAQKAVDLILNTAGMEQSISDEEEA
jgi:antirestriction protein ArdC